MGRRCWTWLLRSQLKRASVLRYCQDALGKLTPFVCSDWMRGSDPAPTTLPELRALFSKLLPMVCAHTRLILVLDDMDATVGTDEVCCKQ